MNLKHNYWIFQKAISKETCENIINFGKSIFLKNVNEGKKIEAYTFGNEEKSSMPDATPRNEKTLSEIKNNEKTYVRDSNVAWLDEQWIYDLIKPYVKTANVNAGWHFDIDYCENLQFTEYKNNGFYGWHKDGDSDIHAVYKRFIFGVSPTNINDLKQIPAGYTTDKNMVGKIRKLSMSINLNSPEEYTGGDLKFDLGLHVNKNERFKIFNEIKPQGSIVVFPSFVDHCVTPVLTGTRYSLVVWYLGRPFK